MNEISEIPAPLTSRWPLWSYQLHRGSKVVIKTRQEVEALLAARACTDELFKGELLRDPRSAVEALLGAELPPDLELRVVEEDAETRYLVLPCNPYPDLSEAEIKANLGLTLEDVAHWALGQTGDAARDGALLARTWRDPAFRRELMADPRAVLERELERPLPEAAEIRVLEETPRAAYIVLPWMRDELGFLAHPPIPTEELSVHVGAKVKLFLTFTVDNHP